MVQLDSFSGSVPVELGKSSAITVTVSVDTCVRAIPSIVTLRDCPMFVAYELVLASSCKTVVGALCKAALNTCQVDEQADFDL